MSTGVQVLLIICITIVFLAWIGSKYDKNNKKK